MGEAARRLPAGADERRGGRPSRRGLNRHAPNQHAWVPLRSWRRTKCHEQAGLWRQADLANRGGGQEA